LLLAATKQLKANGVAPPGTGHAPSNKKIRANPPPQIAAIRVVINKSAKILTSVIQQNRRIPVNPSHPYHPRSH
jgi:hypothetical protein